ncbi:MAG: transcriptional regulator [Deltaproteobacteria bacterium]|nr:MAG: transcriptional regulator [Deltaproteobacteria bacterium]
MARAEQIPRQWRILRRLEAHRFGLSASDLAEEEDCPVRTIYRDLADLEEAGFPLIQERRGKRSLWKLAFHRDAPQVPFNFTEVCGLWLGRALMEFWQGSEIFDSISSAFEKIRSTLPPGVLEHFEEFSDKVVVRGYQLSGKATDFLSYINEALTNNEQLEITYYSPSQGSETKRRIDPYRLWIQDNVIYLIAYCHLRTDIRTFHLSRIKKLEKTGEYFEEDPNFEPDKYLRRGFRKMGGDEVHEVEIRFDESVRHVIEEQQFHDTQAFTEQGDGSILVQFQAGGLQEIRSWVLSFGPQAEVLRPPQLRDQVRESLMAAANRYQ